MGRAELRRAQKEQAKKQKVYTLTQAQIDKIKEDVYNEAATTAFLLMLAIPLEVLITEEYWMKSAKKRIPKFINDMLYLYKAYELGDLSLEEMQEDLKEFAGITLENIKERKRYYE